MIVRHRAITAVIASVLCLVAVAGAARAQTTRLYIASYMGLNLYNGQNFREDTTGASGTINYKNAVSFAGALGLRLNRNVRVEAEVSYRNATVDSADVGGATARIGGRDRTTLAMANLYYDFDLNWKNITPFVTAGLGVAAHDLAIDPAAGLPSATGRSIGFAYQAGAGLMYRVSPAMAFTGDYKYLTTSDVDISNYKAGYHSHEFRLGLQYDLPVGFLN